MTRPIPTLSLGNKHKVNCSESREKIQNDCVCCAKSNCKRLPEQLNPNEDCSLKIESDVWLNTNEAAEYLRISVGTLRNETSNGNVPYYKFGRRNRYRKLDLRNLLLQNRKGGICGN